ncbi:MAG: MFS transporter, partial [Calditrichaeota bacterium]
SQILDFAGYIKPDGTTPDATPPVQPESVIIALKVIVAGLPIVLLVFVYIFARKYPLDKKMHTKLNSYLEWKRGNADNNPLGEQELKELKKSLI